METLTFLRSFKNYFSKLSATRNLTVNSTQTEWGAYLNVVGSYKTKNFGRFNSSRANKNFIF